MTSFQVWPPVDTPPPLAALLRDELLTDASHTERLAKSRDGLQFIELLYPEDVPGWVTRDHNGTVTWFEVLVSAERHFLLEIHGTGMREDWDE